MNTSRDISKLLYVISRAVRRVKFVDNFEISRVVFRPNITTNHAIICLDYYPERFCNFRM